MLRCSRWYSILIVFVRIRDENAMLSREEQRNKKIVPFSFGSTVCYTTDHCFIFTRHSCAAHIHSAWWQLFFSILWFLSPIKDSKNVFFFHVSYAIENWATGSALNFSMCDGAHRLTNRNQRCWPICRREYLFETTMLKWARMFAEWRQPDDDVPYLPGLTRCFMIAPICKIVTRNKATYGRRSYKRKGIYTIHMKEVSSMARGGYCSCKSISDTRSFWHSWFYHLMSMVDGPVLQIFCWKLSS